MGAVVERVRRYLDRLESLFWRGQRSGRVLALLAIVRLSRRGERITPESVAEEARRIAREHPETEWGVTLEAINAGLMSEILEELAREGVIEEVEGGYVLRRSGLLDPEAEIMGRFGHLLLYGGPAR